MKRLIHLFLCAAVLVSCGGLNEESDEFTIPPKPGSVSLLASFDGPGQAAGDINLADFGFGWSAGDEITVFIDDAEEPLVFSVTGFDNSGKAILEGSVDWPDFDTRHNIYAYYKGNYKSPDMTVKGPDFTSDGESVNHVAESLFLFAEPVSVKSPAEEVAGEPVTLKFHNIMSAVKFRVATVSRNVTIGGITLDAENAVFPTDGKVNITASGSEFGKVESTHTSNVKKAMLLIQGNPQLPMISREAAESPETIGDDDVLTFWLPVAAKGNAGGFRILVGTSVGELEFDMGQHVFDYGKSYEFTLVVDANEGGGEWDGVSVVQPQNEGSVFYISSGAELAWVGSRFSTNEAACFVDTTFILTRDIDLGGKDWRTPYPIGGNSNKNGFAGTFDGDGFSIHNFRLCVTRTNEGLFRSNRGVIKNLTVASGEVVQDPATARTHVGVIVGRNDGGSIINCHNHISFETSNITTVGGIVGMNGRSGTTNGLVKYCTNHGDITVTSTAVSRVGGIAGYSESPQVGDNGIVGCANYGKISGLTSVGGICGHMKLGLLTACFNTGEVAGAAGGKDIGGVLGSTEAGTNIITAVYNIGTVSGGSNVGGVCGSNPGSHIHTSYWGGAAEALPGVAVAGTGTNDVTKFGAEGTGTGWPSGTMNGWEASSGTGHWLNLNSWTGGGAAQKYPELDVIPPLLP